LGDVATLMRKFVEIERLNAEMPKRRDQHLRPASADAHRRRPLGLARTHANMRTKQPIRSKRDHFMYLDSLESDHIEPVKMLVKQKAVTEVASSPTSIFAPMSAPPTIKLPEAVAKPPLPSASVWLHSEKVSLAGAACTPCTPGA
jgi:hypothetical protein